jgi:hypothetical protein
VFPITPVRFARVVPAAAIQSACPRELVYHCFDAGEHGTGALQGNDLIGSMHQIAHRVRILALSALVFNCFIIEAQADFLCQSLPIHFNCGCRHDAFGGIRIIL